MSPIVAFLINLDLRYNYNISFTMNILPEHKKACAAFLVHLSTSDLHKEFLVSSKGRLMHETNGRAGGVFACS